MTHASHLELYDKIALREVAVMADLMIAANTAENHLSQEAIDVAPGLERALQLPACPQRRPRASHRAGVPGAPPTGDYRGGTGWWRSENRKVCSCGLRARTRARSREPVNSVSAR